MIPISNPHDIHLDRHGMIEASAGTGKTYTLENLVVRLLKERSDVELEHILLVTFTEKATAELKIRLYEKIALEAENSGIDLALKRKLRETLNQFDRAPIHTIHGFCQTLLKDFAFENKMAFETEVVDDRSLLESALMEDMRSHWPKHYGDGLEEILYLSGFQEKRQRFMETVIQLASTLNCLAGDQLLPEMPKGGYDRIKHEILETCKTLKDLMGDNDAFLTGFEKLNFNASAKKSVNAKIVLPLTEYFQSFFQKPFEIQALSKLMGGLEQVESMGQKGVDCLLPQKWNKGGPNLEVCPNLLPVRDQLVKIIKQVQRLRHLLTEETVFRLQKQIRKTKTRKGWISYQDMLIRVAEALLKPENDALVQRLRERFKVAFIDEFQDTDPVQWQIFQKLFLNPCSGAEHTLPRNLLFLIGDPKQAIYSFRGADVYTYLLARKEIKALAAQNQAVIYSLARNWRSVPELITAFNHLFPQREWFPKQDEATDFEIGYEKVGFPETKNQLNVVTHDPADRGVLNIVDLRSFESTGDAKTGLATFIAREIKYLMQDPIRMVINGEPERPMNLGDICILARTRKEAGVVEKALMAHEIPYMFYKKPGIFLSREAFYTALLFHAILDPTDLSAVKKALLTPFFNFRFSEVSAYDAMTPAHPVKSLLFYWNELAEHRRWARLFQAVLEDSGIFTRDTVDGGWDRRHTNYRQILAFFQQEAYRKNLDFRGICATLDLYRKQAVISESDVDLHQIETEDQKVQIMTMHVSKGLEFPVVFIGGGITGSAEHLMPYHVYHSITEQDGRFSFNRMIDLTKAENPRQYQLEQDEETKRLFYVALTRARFKVYVPFCEKRGGFRGPAATLLSSALCDAFSEKSEKNSHIKWLDHDIHHGLTGKTRLPMDLPISSIPAGQSKTEMISQKDLPPLPHQIRFSDRRIFLDSFSSIHRRNTTPDTREPEGIYLETAVSEKGRDEENTGISTILPDDSEVPGGIQTGLMFHDLLEQIDFEAFLPDRVDSHADPSLSGLKTFESLILKTMEIYGVDPVWLMSVYRILKRVLTAPIAHVSPGFTLAHLSSQSRRHELEFYYPLGPKKQFIRGFVDLVFQKQDRFYIADWKSNVLTDYVPESLGKSMEESGYHLQYRIYTIAVLRWLRLRLGENFNPARHFGGVFYFYLRGMGENGKNGIYFAPPEKLLPLERLERLMLDQDIR